MPKYCKPNKDGLCKFCKQHNRNNTDLCGTVKKAPTTLELAGRYFKEREEWSNQGKPLRSDEEMEHIFSICQSCPLFEKISEKFGRCGDCGCMLHKSRKFMNKIAWATTSCPLDEPKWSATVEAEKEEGS